jgi:hypothetical protein
VNEPNRLDSAFGRSFVCGTYCIIQCRPSIGTSADTRAQGPAHAPPRAPGCNFPSSPGPSKPTRIPRTRIADPCKPSIGTSAETRLGLPHALQVSGPVAETISRNLWVAGHALVLAALLGFMSDAETTQEIVPRRPIVQDPTLSPRARATGMKSVQCGNRRALTLGYRGRVRRNCRTRNVISPCCLPQVWREHNALSHR